jgi:Diadenosine tetraphosphate (Ap4A) hydrolase and other HIT family hydrolases
MSDCIFCKIINKEIPSKIIYEDAICLAFLDISPATKGHTLVIPKKHYQNFLDIDSDTLQHITTITQKLAKKILRNVDAKGCNILTNTGLEAGQTVFHFHIHIIPRFNEKDPVTLSLVDNSNIYDIEEVYQLIQK